MLSQEDNELITQVGPGTPMGTLMREYWLPAMLASELPAPDGDPVRVLLLGEQLIGFRDTSGNVGLIQNLCPHRGASLFFGRNEEGGLRCVYHGWKYDTAGNCTDMPNEPAESNFKSKIHATAYPCVERGGIVWTYMGPRESPPALPDIEANQLPDDEINVTAISRECNWLQGLEGDIDTSHLGFLHFGAQRPENAKPGTFGYYTVKDRAPRYTVVDTDFGEMYGAYRPAEEGQYYWRIAQFLFPFFTHIPTGILGHQVLTRAWVPLDDHHMMFFSMSTNSRNAVRQQLPKDAPAGQSYGPPMLENSTDWFGRFRLVQDAENDYLIDREQQRSASYTGIEGIHTQDQAITESMGSVLNRTNENVGTADIMVIRTRARMLSAVRALIEDKVTPPGVDDPDVYRVRSGGVILDTDVDWLEGIKDLLPAYVDHPELDLSIER